MIILLAYLDFSERLLREIFGSDYSYDSTGIYERLRYGDYSDTIKTYTYEDFFGLRLYKAVKGEIRKADLFRT
jgi:hypothetical protein